MYQTIQSKFQHGEKVKIRGGFIRGPATILSLYQHVRRHWFFFKKVENIYQVDVDLGKRGKEVIWIQEEMLEPYKNSLKVLGKDDDKGSVSGAKEHKAPPAAPREEKE